MLSKEKCMDNKFSLLNSSRWDKKGHMYDYRGIYLSSNLYNLNHRKFHISLDTKQEHTKWNLKFKFYFIYVYIFHKDEDIVDSERLFVGCIS